MITDVMAVVVTFLLLGYYLVIWWRVGRDPKAGTIVTQYEPPLNLSPAALSYIYHEGWNELCSHATLMSLAAKGKLKISKPRYYVLQRVNGEADGVHPEEHVFAQKLFAAGESVELFGVTTPALTGADAELKKVVTSNNTGYFNSNAIWLLPGVAGSLFLIMVLFIAGSMENHGSLDLGLLLWLTLWTIAVSVLGMMAVTLWRRALRAKTARSTAINSATKATLFFVPFLGAEIGVGYKVSKDVGWAPILALIGFTALAFLFLALLKAPTTKGRELLDKIEGFRQFLKTVDVDAINRMNPPAGAPLDLHPHMAYALALNVENDWAEKFVADLHWDHSKDQQRYAAAAKVSLR